MMTADFCDSELHHRAFDIMAKMTPEDFGINMSITEFQDNMADRFNTRFQGLWSIDGRGPVHPAVDSDAAEESIDAKSPGVNRG